MTSHGRHIGFQDGRHEVHPKMFFCDNFGSITDTNIMQVAIPRFSGPANQMVPSAMTSHVGHIGFQDGRHEVHPKTVFCHNLGSTDTNLFQVAIPRCWVRPIKWYHRRWRHIGFQDGRHTLSLSRQNASDKSPTQPKRVRFSGTYIAKTRLVTQMHYSSFIQCHISAKPDREPGNCGLGGRNMY
jgi:hypothetical protein